MPRKNESILNLLAVLPWWMSACVFGGSKKRNIKTLCELERPKGVGGEKKS
jgi:hypothetical protein